MRDRAVFASKLLILYLGFVILVDILLFFRFHVRQSHQTMLLKTTGGIRRIFPYATHKACHVPYTILDVELEQSGMPKCALVHTTRNGRYQLWSVLPFSISPPPQVVHHSDKPFVWATCANTSILAIGTGRTVKVLELTEIGKGTMGSWHERQVINLEHEGDDTSDDMNLRVSMTSDAKTILIVHSVAIVAAFQLQSQPAQYLVQRMMIDHMKLDFNVFTRSMHSNLLVLSSPNYRQTDGVVDVYYLPQIHMDIFTIALLQTLSPPMRAGYFGGTCGIASNGSLLVAAPFMYTGVGAVFVYRLDAENSEFRLSQTLTCPTKVPSKADAHVLNFGLSFRLSENGTWLCIQSQGGGAFVFKFDGDKYNFTGIHVLQAKHVCVDNMGAVVYATENAVYFPNFPTSVLNRIAR